MATGPTASSRDSYGPVPAPNAGHMSRGYGVPANDTTAADFAPSSGNIPDSSPLSQSLQQTHGLGGRFNEDFDARQRGSSVLGDEDGGMQRSSSRASRASSTVQGDLPSRGGTLKKKNSIGRKSSLKRKGSRRSVHAGSIKGVSMQDNDQDPEDNNSVFYTPVPTTGSPTDILANRFQAWRKMLKDLMAYFKEVQSSYEHRSKALMKVSNVINNTNAPSMFLTEGGINEANRVLRDYHKQALNEANKARDIENDVISALAGLRSDLGAKIKEIKSLSGDFKNSVEKEKDGTRKSVSHLEEALAAIDADPAGAVGKGDPFVVRLAVDRQVERQIDEENYLHRAYLNLESSGRELESIVVGEIQKAYNALAGILKREADESYNTVEKLRSGPIAMPKDHEWSQFVEHDQHFVNPRIPLRNVDDIQYPGRHHPAAAEVRAGMLERKSKYLKSYTPGWYVLSPTHLHEFKSADRIYTQPPVMSLYLPEQKLGSHSQPDSSSHKFSLKGRQTGSMHRGHSWVFRAESYETMLAWYDDIKNLTEKTGEERDEFVRLHTRTLSSGSRLSRTSFDSGLEDNEADEVPYSANHSMVSQNAGMAEKLPQRPSPGGRFPSDIQLNPRNLQAPLSPSSGSSEIGHDITTAAGGAAVGYGAAAGRDDDAPESADRQQGYGGAPAAHPQGQEYHPMYSAYGQPEHVYDQNPQTYTLPAPQPAPAVANEYQQTPASAAPTQSPTQNLPRGLQPEEGAGLQRHDSTYKEWLAPVAAGAGGVAAGAAGNDIYRQHKEYQEQQRREAEARRAATETAGSSVNSPTSQTGTDESSQPTTTYTGDMIPPKNPARNSAGSFQAIQGDEHAHPTGRIFPSIMRHDTDTSVSNLHVPGEYPKQRPA